MTAVSPSGLIPPVLFNKNKGHRLPNRLQN